MDIIELKKAAQERELSVIRKRSTGPIIVMVSRTGKNVGVFGSVEEAESAILEFPVVPPIKPAPVKWTTIAQVQDEPKHCPNGYGPECMCLDDTFVYLCAVNVCANKAECNGTCRGHFSQLRKFGDLTQAAIKKTDLYHQEGLVLRVFPAVLPLKMIQQTAVDWSTLTPKEINKITDGIIGMSVKFTGTEYVLLDKDGFVLDRVTSKDDWLTEE